MFVVDGADDNNILYIWALLTRHYANDAWWRVWHAKIYMSRSWNVNTMAKPACWHFNFRILYICMSHESIMHHLFCRITN